MRNWPSLLASGFILTVGLIACFAPGDDDVTGEAALRLPMETPALLVMRSPALVLDDLAETTGNAAFASARWRASGLDVSAPMTLARWPGEAPLWVLSVAIGDEAIVVNGVDDLLGEIASRHHLLVDGDRVHALVASGPCDRAVWRDTVATLTAPEEGERLSDHDDLEPMGFDDVMLYLAPAALAESLTPSPWIGALADLVGSCTLRGASAPASWEVEARCALPQGSPLRGLGEGGAHGLTVTGEETWTTGHLALLPQTLEKLWRSLGEGGDALDGAHALVMDIAEAADISTSALWSEVFTGEASLAVTALSRPGRRLGLVGSVGIADEEAAQQLMNAIRGLAEETPGVRVHSDRVDGHAGWTIEWLRHRGHDLSLALAEDRVIVAFGSADLEDSLDCAEAEAWAPPEGALAVALPLGRLLDHEETLGELTITLSGVVDALDLTLSLTRPEAAPERRARVALLEVAHDAAVHRASRALASQLAAVCDAVDLHAIDHGGLPATLERVAGAASALDPWGRPFVYAQPAVRRPHHRYDLCSKGPDGFSDTADDVCHR